MPTVKALAKIALVSILFISTSCVKDVDLGQVDDVVIPPEAAIDLVYFTLDPMDFHAPGPSPNLLASDYVRLEFLDDEYIQTGLVKANFNFFLKNSFQQPFLVTISFLSERSIEKYRIEFTVPAGSMESPKVVDYNEIIEGENLNAIKESIEMLVQLEMQPNSKPIDGALQLKSKAFYNFEF